MKSVIACSPLTGRIQIGAVNKAGDAFIGDPKDVTSQVIGAIIEKAEFHGGSFEVEGGGKKFVITVVEVNP